MGARRRPHLWPMLAPCWALAPPKSRCAASQRAFRELLCIRAALKPSLTRRALPRQLHGFERPPPLRLPLRMITLRPIVCSTGAIMASGRLRQAHCRRRRRERTPKARASPASPLRALLRPQLLRGRPPSLDTRAPAREQSPRPEPPLRPAHPPRSPQPPPRPRCCMGRLRERCGGRSRQIVFQTCAAVSARPCKQGPSVAPPAPALPPSPLYLRASH